jgi:hypothetical protein
MLGLGYDGDLFILAFDHRGSFVKKFFGIEGTPSPEDALRIADAKAVIYEGFQGALEGGVDRVAAGILVDEQFGGEIAKRAMLEHLTLAMPVEKSGQDEFDFEYGDEFGRHIEAMNPTFCKVLVRYNPESDAAMKISGFVRKIRPISAVTSANVMMTEINKKNALQVARCLDNAELNLAEEDLSAVIGALVKLNSSSLQTALNQLQPALYNALSIGQENATISMRPLRSRRGIRRPTAANWSCGHSGPTRSEHAGARRPGPRDRRGRGGGTCGDHCRPDPAHRGLDAGGGLRSRRHRAGPPAVAT